MAKKINAKFIILFIIVLILLPNLFNKTRIAILTTQKNITVSSDAGNWKRDYKGEYVSVYNTHSLPDEFNIRLSAPKNIYIQKIQLYWGNWLIKEIRPTDYYQWLKFNDDYSVADNLFAFSVSDINITLFLTTYKRITALLHTAVLICLIPLLTVAVIMLKKYRFAEHILLKRPQIIIGRLRKTIYKISRYYIYYLLGFIIMFKVNHYANLMHIHELLFLCIAFLFVNIAIASYTNNHKEYLFCCALTIVPLFFSLERITDYLLVDEPRAIAEQLFLTDDILRHWTMGSSKINYVIMGTLLKRIPFSLLNFFGISSYQYAKLLHWLIGIIFTIVICKVAAEKCINNKKMQCLNFSVIFSGLLCLCVYLSALKFYNYDTFALLLGVLGTLYLYLSIKELNYKFSLAAMTILSLAMLEKVIVLPYWGISILVCACLCSLAWVKNRKEIFAKSLMSAILVLMVPISLSYSVSTYTAVLLRRSQFPAITFNDVVASFTWAFTSVIDKVFKIDNNVTAVNILIILLLIFLMTAAAIVFQFIMINAKRKFQSNNIIKKIGYICLPIIALGWILGVFFLYAQPTMYIAPVYENSNNYFINSSQADALLVYFPAKNNVENILYFIGSLLGSSVDAFPTLMLLLGFLCLLFYKYDKDISWNFLVFLSVIIVPVIYGVTLLTPWLRYVNIYVSVVAILLLIKFCRFIGTLAQKRSLSGTFFLIVFFIGFSAIETYTFAPSYGAFWPIWNITAYSHSELETGEVMTIGAGQSTVDWILAGNKIIEYCNQNNIDLSDVRMYSNYHGEWNSEYSVSRMPGWRKLHTAKYPGFSLESFDFSENAFYIFCQWGNAMSAVPYKCPSESEIEPILRVTYRGATTAWVFTGDQLQDYITNFFNEQYN